MYSFEQFYEEIQMFLFIFLSSFIFAFELRYKLNVTKTVDEPLRKFEEL